MIPCFDNPEQWHSFSWCWQFERVGHLMAQMRTFGNFKNLWKKIWKIAKVC
jgi:hypothetical protein